MRLVRDPLGVVDRGLRHESVAIRNGRRLGYTWLSNAGRATEIISG